MLYTCFYTVNSFLELIPFLLKLPGVTYFLTEKLSQDPLEKFFGCQRHSGGFRGARGAVARLPEISGSTKE